MANSSTRDQENERDVNPHEFVFIAKRQNDKRERKWENDADKRAPEFVKEETRGRER
jgi:hypothetical protein